MLGPFVILGGESIIGVTRPLTEDQQGGTAPEPETSVSAAPQAIEEPVGTASVAVADDPAETTVEAETTETAQESTAESDDGRATAESRPAADGSTDVTPAETGAGDDAAHADAASSESVATEAHADQSPDASAETARAADPELDGVDTADAPAAEEPEPAP